MKNSILIAATIGAFTLQSFTGYKPHTDNYKVDTTASTMEWFAEKLTGKHNGTVKLQSGSITNNHGSFGGTFIIDMTTIEDKDLESPEYKAKLENHLKSEDFFDVAKYPTAKFVLTSVTPLAEKKDGMSHSIKGLLTIKDKTNEISFNAAVNMEGVRIYATGSAIVDRSKFDVKYGSKTFFKDIGDKVIYDDFTLKFAIVASK